MDHLGGWVDKSLYLCFEEPRPDDSRRLVMRGCGLEELIFRHGRRLTVGDVPGRYRRENVDAMRAAPIAKLELFATRDNSPVAPGCFTFGSKIVFVGRHETLVFETDSDVDPNPELVPSNIVLPFQHHNPFPILVRQRGIRTLLALASNIEAQTFFEQLSLPADPQDPWTPLPEPLLGAHLGRFACVFADTKILVSGLLDGIYMFDARVPERGWRPRSQSLGLQHLPWDKRALVYGFNGDFIVIAYSSNRPWMLSAYFMAYNCDYLHLMLDPMPIMPPHLHPPPTNWAFAPVEDRKFTLVMTNHHDFFTYVTVWTYEILMGEGFEIVLLGTRHFTVAPAEGNGNPHLLGAFVL
ncbi:uncharacterized protein LOC133718763 [Rosa rugosa]|uniref:uncharacterized protein LOC133718763 n=1 Tax=Rosa rugosa TaxID=74645 RepID=UPI002B405FD7|nr:uncharacterized protein LOC133718763 [Rosa rugosa]XP_062001621.1 uncharacterized protein LOC133718763 [Rosa rugosa]XP_062001622.1 uncharacterized protein LOC133718763 [Rosa rugosa]XP_062001623.1 uncharacterized protein LOC133718763 [Rosa rugosa]XP_062001624.1 uncharacterized protein LOC133718763 [Rosa rugosa]XP_062001625.1 uncharacterized protein LOC133718763 [Rosa rugosa]XP_062001626.1 uncharacterized protein LOC133718763 [Rosa rugosa]XP_062001627.1 uncharacterized protein LOC133718763 [